MNIEVKFNSKGNYGNYITDHDVLSSLYPVFVSVFNPVEISTETFVRNLLFYALLC